MQVLRSYVVRVYRQETDGVAGVVESVETGDLTPFRSPDELWTILVRPARRSRTPSIADPPNGK